MYLGAKHPKSPKILFGCIILALFCLVGSAAWILNSYRAYVNVLQSSLKRHGFEAGSLHGDMEQFLKYQTKRGEFNPTTSNNAQFNRVINGSWTRLAGNGEFQSWPKGKHQRTKAIVVFGDFLCAGLSSAGDKKLGSQVWCYKDSS